MRMILFLPKMNLVFLFLFFSFASWDLYAINDSKAIDSISEDYVINFGLLGKSDKGVFIEKKTNEIPYVTRERGQIFGITIQPIIENSYEFYLVLYLPGIPKKLSGEALSSAVSEDGKIFRSPVHKVIGMSAYPMWLDEGDPVGKYKAEIYVNDELVKTIEYEVVK